jgi:hypothetical protein
MTDVRKTFQAAENRDFIVRYPLQDHAKAGDFVRPFD